MIMLQDPGVNTQHGVSTGAKLFTVHI